MKNHVTRTTLDNGLTVILKEVHTAPVISWWVAYRIGSRNEPTGKTGISHWVEHMMFKGTDKFPAGVLDREIDRSGGQWNAFTSWDYTMYYETVPANKIDIPMQAEADRMVNAQFDPDETESERTVIISERQGAENKPLFWLGEEVHGAAFRVHGYHHEILGDMADLRSISRDDLYNHYEQYYRPSNATLVAVGDFETKEMLEKIEEIYGKLPAGDAPELFARPEPLQQGERRVCVERPGNTAFLQVAYHVPPATHDDWFKIEILDSILVGLSGVSKTSRLYRALVKSEIAASVGAGISATIDPYLYTFTITLRDGRTPQEAETVLFQEIDNIVRSGVSDYELKRAKKQARANFAYETESVSNQAYWLARSAILGDYDWFDNYVSRLEAVTAEDVQRVAGQYLTRRNRVVGYLIPTSLEEA